MPRKAYRRHLDDSINTKQYELTVHAFSQKWRAVVKGDGFQWNSGDNPIELDDAKHWAIKKALTEAHSAMFETVHPLQLELDLPWQEIELPDE